MCLPLVILPLLAIFTRAAVGDVAVMSLNSTQAELRFGLAGEDGRAAGGAAWLWLFVLLGTGACMHCFLTSLTVLLRPFHVQSPPS